MRSSRSADLLLASTLLLPLTLPASPTRIHGAIENGRRFRLTGHMNPKAQSGSDLGRMDSSAVLRGLTLVLGQTPSQQSDLEALLARQQDPSSPEYHRWLTPEQFAERFGVSSVDIRKITDWLASQNLHVTGTGRARNWISFDGTAAAVNTAFRAELHRYEINGKRHFANSAEPSIPVALDTTIRGIHGLSDFRLKPKSVRRSVDRSTLSPQFTSRSGDHFLSPEDFATIYNLKPLYDAGMRGAGQTIVVAGQTQIDLADIQQFRTKFNLPAAAIDVTLAPDTKDPGIDSNEVGEADLDIEWASAAAPEAKIIYVYSNDVMDAVQYAIDQNLAPILSVSYGGCEAQTARSDAMIFRSWAMQANAQGMTWFNASGDSGGADCVTGTSTSGAGLSVDIPASVPEVTGVGGTVFTEGSATPWNDSNTPGGGSVRSYIPEAAWNDSAPRDPSASGGGASAFFSKPVWQTGIGLPNDGSRDVPDVALNASADHDGYMVYTEGKLAIFGGTSVGSPAFAGIAALLNQYLMSGGAQSGLGNINVRLYGLAQTTPAVFHDITSGDTMVTVTCSGRSRNCVPGSYGFNAGPGYDQATGLGSIDAYALVTNWRGPSAEVARGTASLSLTASAATITRNDSLTLTATLTATNGGTPQGTVAFSLGSAALGTATLTPGAGSAAAVLLVSNTQLATGINTISATWSGDSSYNSASASVVVTVAPLVSGTPLIAAVVDAASFRRLYAPGMIVSVFGTDLAPFTSAAAAVPLPAQMAGVSASVNGVAAPLQYVSTGQMNLQIPYETTPNTTAVLVVNNNGHTASISLTVSNAAPAVFADTAGALVPASTAHRGQQIELYLTGAGSVSPSISSGSSPGPGTPLANLPMPVQAARVTVGGADAPVEFIGIPQGLVGVVQINILVPSDAPAGAQTLVVTIGGVASVPVSLTITN